MGSRYGQWEEREDPTGARLGISWQVDLGKKPRSPKALHSFPNVKKQALDDARQHHAAALTSPSLTEGRWLGWRVMRKIREGL